MSDDAALPLSGLTVLDVASFIAAPVAATVLADYGANVIKVEPPETGDPNRHIMATLASYPKADVNYPWQMDSRGKRSIAIDLKTEDGQAVLHRLAAKADVFITNYPITVRGRLKIAYEDIAPLNEQLIYASFTGYGESGPDRDQLGFDSTAYFARSGLLDCNRYEGQPPGVVMPAQGDRGSGMTLLAAILMGLVQRAKTGRGVQVSSSLYANGLWANGVGAQAALLGSFLPPRPPRERPRNPLTNLYKSADDRWMQLTIVREDKQWGAFCRMIARPELEHDARFAEATLRRRNGVELTQILDAIFVAEPWEVWRKKFIEAGVPVGLIGQLKDLAGDEQAVAAGAVVETDIPGMPRTLAAPFQISGITPKRARPAPGVGEQTDEILSEAGFTAADIARLRGGNAVG
jgi:crotonobetainyl-CoA:carnitine CoA-transferase CaiB-like acyl-CoA transferase